MLGEDVFEDLDIFLQSSGFEYRPILDGLSDRKKAIVERLLSHFQGSYTKLTIDIARQLKNDLRDAKEVDTVEQGDEDVTDAEA